MTYEDLPLIRCRKTPTDAQLEAERDVKYRAELDNDDDWPVAEVIG